MSFLTKLAVRPAPALRASRILAIADRRSFLHTTSVRAALSESDLGKHGREDRDREIDHHKDDQLQKQKEGKGHWKSELASNSEATVKADRGDMHASEENIKNMQKETEEMAKQQHNEK